MLARESLRKSHILSTVTHKTQGCERVVKTVVNQTALRLSSKKSLKLSALTTKKLLPGYEVVSVVKKGTVTVTTLGCHGDNLWSEFCSQGC